MVKTAVDTHSNSYTFFITFLCIRYGSELIVNCEIEGGDIVTVSMGCTCEARFLVSMSFDSLL